MKKSYFFAPLFFVFSFSLSAQQLVSDTLLGTKTVSELTAQFGLPFIQYGVKYYRITYTTPDVHGVLDTVSGLVVLPDNPSKVFPRLVYTHGFASLKFDVPSFNVVQNGGEGTIGLLFSGLGYAAVLPDYLGMGLGKGFHPAFHAASEASTAADMLRAFDEFVVAHGAHVNDQLFVTGYSEGGHASMALHRLIQTELSDEFVVTAATHLSGPYSIGEVMRDWTLSDSVLSNVGWLPITVLSYQLAYGNIYNQLTDVFKAPYAAPIGQYYSGAIDASQLGTQLVTQLLANEGTLRPSRMLQPAFLQAVLTDPNHPYNVAMKLNNTYAWAPNAPTRIFYCAADEVIPYTNGVVAKDTMTALGAVDLMASDVSSTSNHLDCVTPALTNTIFFFIGYQQIGTFVSTADLSIQSLDMRPNPAGQSVVLNYLPGEGRLSISDINGRIRYEGAVSGNEYTVDLSGLENGIFFVRYLSDGKVWQGKLVHNGF